MTDLKSWIHAVNCNPNTTRFMLVLPLSLFSSSLEKNLDPVIVAGFTCLLSQCHSWPQRNVLLIHSGSKILHCLVFCMLYLHPLIRIRHHNVGLPLCKSACHSAQFWGPDVGHPSARGPTSLCSGSNTPHEATPLPGSHPDLGPSGFLHKGGCLPTFPNLMTIGPIPRRKRRRWG